MPLRLCCRAPRTLMKRADAAWRREGRGARGELGEGDASDALPARLRNTWPRVGRKADDRFRVAPSARRPSRPRSRLPSRLATSSGVPAATMRPPASPPSGPEVDDPVGRLDDLGIVLDHQHRVAGVDEVVQHLQQQLDVGEVQAGGRLVQQIERPAGALLDQFAGQLDPLGLAAGERGRGLAELHVVQPHVVQRLELVVDGRDVLEVRAAPPGCPFPALAAMDLPL